MASWVLITCRDLHSCMLTWQRNPGFVTDHVDSSAELGILFCFVLLYFVGLAVAAFTGREIVLNEFSVT